MLVVCVAAPAMAAPALSVARSIITTEVNDKVCVAPKPVRELAPAQRQVFFWASLKGIRGGAQLRIEWVDPAGAVALAAPYNELPTAPEICLISQMPVAGFPAGRQPGEWTVRLMSGSDSLSSTSFRILPEPDNGEPRIASVARVDRNKEIEFTVLGSGFREGATLHVAQYTRSGGWKYVALMRPETLDSGRAVGRTAALPASDYVLLVRNADGKVSLPEPFVVATGRAYRLPTASGEPWVVTQGPYGTFSHWGNSLHAFDIAPRAGRCIVAMRAGVVSTFDRGMRQNVRSRSFGNYITVDHGDGEYSHYAHLTSGSFLVRSGEHVAQGQALAMAGNSGYTLGEGGGVHVHVHVTRAPAISAQSVAFRFEELPEGWRPGRYTAVVSKNGTPGACGIAPRDSVLASAGGGAPSKLPTLFEGSVPATQWWNEFVWVPKNAPTLEAMLAWKDGESALDLHLMAPDGHHFGWYGDTAGYSGRQSNPQSFRVARPASGWWRIAVQSSRGGPVATPFEVRTSAQRPSDAWKADAVGGGASSRRRATRR